MTLKNFFAEFVKKTSHFTVKCEIIELAKKLFFRTR